MRRLYALLIALVLLGAVENVQRRMVIVAGVCATLNPTDNWFLWWWYECEKEAGGGGGSGAGMD